LLLSGPAYVISAGRRSSMKRLRSLLPVGSANVCSLTTLWLQRQRPCRSRAEVRSHGGRVLHPASRSKPMAFSGRAVNEVHLRNRVGGPGESAADRLVGIEVDLPVVDIVAVGPHRQDWTALVEGKDLHVGHRMC